MEKSLRIAFMAVAGVFAAILLFLITLTMPRFGTPFANWALGSWGPDGARVERAHLKFPALTTASVRQLDMPDRLQAEQLETRFNPFGFLPGVSWVSRLEAANGSVRFDGREKDDEPGESESETELSDYRAIIDEVALSDIEIRIDRSDEQAIVQVAEARGSLRSGAL